MSDQKRRISRRAILTGVPAVISGSCTNGKEQEPSSQVNFTPAGPETLAGVKLTIVSAETGLPVSGAKVWGSFAGDFLTDDQGEVSVPAMEGSPLEISVDGYLKRETRFAKDRRTISLWPILAQDDLYFRDLLYFKGELRSLQASTVAVSFGTSILDDRVFEAHEKATQRIQAALGERITFRTRSRTGDIGIAVSVDPTDREFIKNPGWGGYTSLTLSNGVIKGAVIVYRDVQRAIVLAQHELGHCLGLGHVLVDGPWMMHPSNYYLADDFNETERRAIRFSMIRHPRWLSLDNDRDRSSVVSAAVQPEAYIVGC